MVYVPKTWFNEPNHTTPIVASWLNDIENGIAAAHVLAAIAQAAAESASGGGDSSFIPGLALTMGIDDGPAISAELDRVEKGLRGGHLTVHGNAGDICYINSVVQVKSNNVILDADIDIVFGPLGQVQGFGEVVEVPATTKPKLTADADAGDTVLHLSVVSFFSAGTRATIRGHRDDTGKPTQIFSFTVTSVDTVGLTITIDPPLDEDYLVTNDTAWSNKLSQVTAVVSTDMTGTPNRGELIVDVDDSGDFAVGDVIQLMDDTYTKDDDGPLAPQPGNFPHKEQAIIVLIPSSTKIQIDHPLFHSYDLAQGARIQKLRSLDNSWVKNWNVTWTDTAPDTRNAFEWRYAFGGGYQDCRARGGPGASWTTQAFRQTDCLATVTRNCIATGADDVTAGRGYGATFYGSTLCRIEGGYYSGCRHSILWYNGASGCVASNVLSDGDRISAYDWHGADCVDNLAIGCTAAGGSQNTADSSVRTAFKFGNPSHVLPGDSGNLAIGCKVTNYDGVAIEGIPSGSGNAFRDGEIRGAKVGIRLGPLAVSTTLTTAGYEVTGTQFYDVETPFQIDGGSGQTVTDLLLDDNTWHRCGRFTIANAPRARLIDQRIIEPQHAGDYAVHATNCPGLQVKHGDYSAADKFIYLTGCTNARITGNDLHDLTTTVVLGDGGGNTGLLYRGNDSHPYTPTRVNTGSGPSSSTTVVL